MVRLNVYEFTRNVVNARIVKQQEYRTRRERGEPARSGGIVPWYTFVLRGTDVIVVFEQTAPAPTLQNSAEISDATRHLLTVQAGYLANYRV